MVRQKLLAKLHCVKKELALDDEVYRAAMQAAVGKNSAALMSEREIVKSIHYLVAKGRDPYTPSPESIWKIKTMWHELYRGDSDTLHLRQFLFHHFKVSDIRFLDRDTAYKAIEALKKMANRKRS